MNVKRGRLSHPQTLPVCSPQDLYLYILLDKRRE